jgi:hypothetical protein
MQESVTGVRLAGLGTEVKSMSSSNIAAPRPPAGESSTAVTSS